MLRTNSKQAVINLRKYITEHVGDVDVYTDDFGELCYNILTRAAKEIKSNERWSELTYNEFERWCQGLPTVLDTTYYLGKAINDLGDILEETEEERKEYTEYEAVRLLTLLIYRELIKGKCHYICNLIKRVKI